MQDTTNCAGFFGRRRATIADRLDHSMRMDTSDESHRRQARAGRLSGLAWLLILISPIANLLQGHHSATFVGVSLLALVAFVAVYVYGYFTTFFAVDETVKAWIVILLLAAIVSAMSLGLGNRWLGAMVFVATVAGSSLEEPMSFLTLAGIAVYSILIGALSGESRSGLSSLSFQLVLIGMALIFLRRLIRTNAELRIAREENARLAVSEERLRFARDLHDLLGHSLSVIALKSELAGRLVEVDPERAREEVADIEQVTREALREVREAVSGYRQPALDAELNGARAALDAAAIECAITKAVGQLPSVIESTLGWAVREGVTNVIRHSGAQRCDIRISQAHGNVQLTITDDGRGGSASTSAPSGRSGCGLPGLLERLTEHGGTLTGGPLKSGGFQLEASLPISGAFRPPVGTAQPSPRLAVELTS